MLYYQIMLYLSLIFSGLFLLKWNKYVSLNYSLSFLLVPFINLGYLRIAAAENVSEALLANGLVYLCSCLLQLTYLTYIISFVKIKLPKIIGILLFSVSMGIGMVSFTTGQNGLLYKSAVFGRDGEVGYLIKEYGPVHTVYYILIALYLLTDIGLLIYALMRRDVSKKNSVILLSMYIVDVFIFTASRAFGLNVELMPAVYVVTQLLMLVVSSRLRLYSVTEMAMDTLSSEGTTGYIIFDRHRHYLGSGGPAQKYIPEIGNLYIDQPIHRGDQDFEMINKWLDISDLSKTASEFSFARNDKIYRVVVIILYGYRKSRIKCYQLSIDDVTDERRYIRLLQEGRRSAENVSQAKGDFLARMSHEIRTPINAILGMDEMILRESSEEQTLEYAEDIRKAGNTLLGLINDILDFSKIEAGKTQIITAEYQLSSMLNDIVNMIEPRAVEKKLRFVPEIDPGTPDRLFGDEMRIKQIIMNLLTNAVKYTSSGSVTLSISHERADEYVRLRVSVRDTGSGIKKEDVEKLFIAFERIDEARNRSIEGTGLGLTITQQLLTLMDSRLEIESVYGEGSDFRFSLKQKIAGDDPVGDYGKALERSRAARKTYRESFTAPDANVLVVDDTDMNLVVFTKLLKKTRMRIDTATSGDEAISLAERNRYDIIFLDHRMPEKDGIETLHEIMSDEKGLNRATPAVCLTANAISGMREKYLAEGFREYITKPIDPMRLEAMIIALLPDGLVRPAENDDDYMPAAESAEDELMGIFLDSLPRSYAQIERFCADGDIKNYTIKVHALKSTARLVGESELSALAEKLENAGEKGDIGFIRDNTGTLLGMYRGVAERYGRSFDEPAVNEDLPEATEDMMEEAYRNMHAAAVNFDYDELFEVLSVLGGFRVPEAHRQKIRDLTAAAENVDWGELKRLLS